MCFNNERDSQRLLCCWYRQVYAWRSTVLSSNVKTFSFLARKASKTFGWLQCVWWTRTAQRLPADVLQNSRSIVGVAQSLSLKLRLVFTCSSTSVICQHIISAFRRAHSERWTHICVRPFNWSFQLGKSRTVWWNGRRALMISLSSKTLQPVKVAKLSSVVQRSSS